MRQFTYVMLLVGIIQSSYLIKGIRHEVYMTEKETELRSEIEQLANGEYYTIDEPVRKSDGYHANVTLYHEENQQPSHYYAVILDAKPNNIKLFPVEQATNNKHDNQTSVPKGALE